MANRNKQQFEMKSWEDMTIAERTEVLKDKMDELFVIINGVNQGIFALSRLLKINPVELDRETGNIQKNMNYLADLSKAGQARVAGKIEGDFNFSKIKNKVKTKLTGLVKKKNNADI